MPTAPKKNAGIQVNSDTMNAILNESPSFARMGVPYADGSTENLHEIGGIITKYVALTNEFLGIINRIALTIVTSKIYYNHFAMMKRGRLEFGETIQEQFITICKPHHYNLERATNEVFKIEKPDVRSAFYYMNYKEFYKQTIEELDMQSCFMSYQGMADFIGRIVDQMYTSAEYDEEQVMLYTFDRWVLNGNMHNTPINAVSTANMKSIVTKVKATSNKMQFMKPIYNAAGVPNFSKPSDQYILISSDFDAAMDVEVLAGAFNMSVTNFLQQRILVDSFGSLDTERLNTVFEDYKDGTYTAITDAEKAQLDAIPLAIIDKNFFAVYDMRERFTENFNGEGVYWNYWYHQQKTFAISPFANGTYFSNAPITPSVPDDDDDDGGETS